MTYFGFVKDSSFGWQKDFRVPNLMSLQVFLMRFNGQWPIDFARYLPKYLSFLSKPLVLLVKIFWCLLAGHISLFFFIGFIIKLNSENSTIPEITTCFLQSMIYGFALFTTIHFQWNHKDLAKIISFVTEKFKMRSARGSNHLWCAYCFCLIIKELFKFFKVWLMLR